MRIVVKSAGLLCVILLCWTVQATAWSWTEKPLLRIDGDKFSRADFEHWWANWREKDMSFPEDPGEFVDWQLLVREARQMELYMEPNYRRKVDTFLKARSLMILKEKEIDARIDVNDKRLWDRYVSEYCPRWRVELLSFDDEQLAAQTLQSIKKGEASLAEFRDGGKVVEGVTYLGEKTYRRNFKPEGWEARLNSLKVNEITGPIALGKGFVLLNLLAKEGPDQEDFAANMARIKKDEWDNQQAILTIELLVGLRKQYNVEVNEEALAAMDPAVDPPEEEAAAILVKTAHLQVTVGDFLAMVRKEVKFRLESGFYKGESDADLKKRVLNNLLSQTLTARAALDKHYEEEEPFSHVFRFYTQHRLISELERRLFATAPPDDAAVGAYYKAHIAEFTKPEVVSVAVLEDDAKLGEKIWTEISLGADFFAVAGKYYSRHPVVQDIPAEHLEPTVRAVVAGLAEGEVSRPFDVKEHTAMVKLVARRAAEPIPLDTIRDEMIRRIKRERYEDARKNYLDQLKSRSRIEVNHKVWASILKEFGEGNSAD